MANNGPSAEIAAQQRGSEVGEIVRSRSTANSRLGNPTKPEAADTVKPIARSLRGHGEAGATFTAQEVVSKANDTFQDLQIAKVWLHDYCPALQGIPQEIIKTPARRDDVLNVLACIDHGMIY